MPHLSHRSHRRTITVLVCLLAALPTTRPSRAGDTHGYRGINTSGRFAGKGLLRNWPKGGPPLLWKHFVAGGFAGPLVKDGKVYAIGGNPGRLYVFTLDGKLLRTIPMGPADWKRFSGSRSTPLVYGNLAFGQMPNANICAVDLQTEETRWMLNAWKSIGSGKGTMGWGVPESPMLHQDKIILNPCSRDEDTPGLVALNADTGDIAWELPGRTNEKRISAADVSGALFRHNGRWVIAYPTWCYLLCVDADSGKLLWEIPNVGSKNLTPVYDDGLLLWEPAGGRIQMLRLNRDASSYEVLWTRAGGLASYSHAVILNGRVYAFHDADAPLDDTRRGPEDNCDFLLQKPERAARSDGAVARIGPDGKRLWSVRVEPRPGILPVSSPVLSKDILVVQGKYLCGLSVADGSQLWRSPLPNSMLYSTPVKERLQYGNVLITGWGAVIRATDGAVLVHDGCLYTMDTGCRAHVLDSTNGREIYAQPLIASGVAAAPRSADLVLANNLVYAPGLGPKRITVAFRQGKEFHQEWRYACAQDSPGNPAFTDNRQYVCVGPALYCIGGATPARPTPPEVSSMAPDHALNEATGSPISAFESGKCPGAWTALGPIRNRGLTTDHLAGIGGVTNAVLRATDAVKHKTRTYRAKSLGPEYWWCNGKFTANVRAIDVSGVFERKWNTTGYFYSVIEFDRQQHVRFSDLTPLGILWNPKSRLEMTAYLADKPISPGQTLLVDKGRYPLMLQVTIGECESWGKIWFAPRFDNVDQEIERKRLEFERRMKDWPLYRESLTELFVLG